MNVSRSNSLTWSANNINRKVLFLRLVFWRTLVKVQHDRLRAKKARAGTFWCIRVTFETKSRQTRKSRTYTVWCEVVFQIKIENHSTHRIQFATCTLDWIQELSAQELVRRIEKVCYDYCQSFLQMRGRDTAVSGLHDLEQIATNVVDTWILYGKEIMGSDLRHRL